MPLQSDLVLDSSKFRQDSISKQTSDFNDGLIKIMLGGPRWWDVGPEKYRQMRWNGETPLPKPRVLESGTNMKLPSRDSGREIPIRVFRPTKGEADNLFYHIHGGGWVLQSEAYQDVMLQYLADHANVVVVSVGYRLAPEDPYPAGNDDCVDIAEYLVDNAEREFGVPLAFMGGESAGGHLSVVTCYKLLETRSQFAFKGLILNYGAFDLSGFLPQAWNFKLPLVLDLEIMQHYISLPSAICLTIALSYLPNTTEKDRRNPMISPFFADLKKMKLPPALFTCGTLDPLLDDSVMMHAKWAMSSHNSILKVYPGAPHGFSMYPIGSTEQTQKVLDDIMDFIAETK